jgi:hypothetical protein
MAFSFVGEIGQILAPGAGAVNKNYRALRRFTPGDYAIQG